MNDSFFLLEKQIEEHGGKADFLTKRKHPCGVMLDSLETNYRKLQTELENNHAMDAVVSKTLQNTAYALGKYAESIVDEICDDVWFFLREVIQIPKDHFLEHQSFLNQDTRADDDRNYQIHPWEGIYVFCYENNIPIIIDGFWGIDYSTIIASLHIHALFCRIREQRNNSSCKIDPEETNHLYQDSDMTEVSITMRENAILEETLKRWTFLTPVVLKSTLTNFETQTGIRSKALTKFHTVKFADSNKGIEKILFHERKEYRKDNHDDSIDSAKIKLPDCPNSLIQFKLSLNQEWETILPYIRSYGISYDTTNSSYKYRFLGTILTRQEQQEDQIDRLITNHTLVPFQESMYSGSILEYRKTLPMPYVLYHRPTLIENILQEDTDKMDTTRKKIKTLESILNQPSMENLRYVLL